jgi:small GTP-binding protein
MKQKKKETKIVILGSYNSGKTTTLENICEKSTKVEYKGTTIALDYGNVIFNGEKVHIFASPGQQRFKFMREILSQGLDGAIVVVDASVGLTPTDVHILNRLNSRSVPYVIFANKQDINPGNLEQYSIIQGPIIPTVAREGKGINDGLNLLLKSINNNG